MKAFGRLGSACTITVLFALVAIAISPGPCAADGAPIDISFSFVPARAGYCAGDNVSIEFMVVNTMPSGDYVYDDLAYMEKVTNISVHFSWMAPNEFTWLDVSNISAWLEPDGIGCESYYLPLVVPDGLLPATYSYYFRVEYLAHTAWGDLTYTWGSGTTYRDFVVESSNSATTEGAAVDYSPYLAFMAVVLSIGALGAVLYSRSQRDEVGVATAQVAMADEGNGSYPLIRPMPGEHFPVERGFIYLVKEKRPRFSFEMFNEAVGHGASGMLIAREHPNRLRQMYSFEAGKILWLTRRAGVDHIDPTELSLLSLRITKFVEPTQRAVVLIEGLEYMITQNDFESVLRFTNHLHDFVISHDAAVIIVVDPRVLTTRELALLERSARVVEPIDGREGPSRETQDGT
ncbi:MAG: DUF835 domain-containing protein [Thermoplasmata archaeon]|nr:DUF835 domain-containing protein [Thermoplasmata archaeon]